MTNGMVRALVVADIGRVMQFGWAGSESEIFWQDHSLYGLRPQCLNNWMNFGGDKTWPAPQEHWERVTGHPWPPPATFDAMPMQAGVEDCGVLLVSAVDPHYGVQIFRHISMDPDRPAMVIKTTFCKVLGAPTEVGVWVVTQLRDPERVFVLLQTQGSVLQRILGPEPFALSKQGRLLSLRRDPANKVKISTDGSSVLWMDTAYVLRIDGRAGTGNDACTAEVYTNSDPLPYVELEMVGPVKSMGLGDHLELTTTYTLARRTLADTTAEANKAFGLES